ncbi:flavodoxin domain-containing protein [Metapseudomonas furukawaii]|uniref:Sulfite reductase [NADPH] flavoprotein alpha-component n=1 Tax=Metapseudomonas furukawaii TaxID=1149133 RepID=A0AAD1BXQ6_METFU|nr:flavodoxin domain-containing protein [Pseudomonas furukawaii]ELS27916.1 Sulfite reductase NADPH flavoprotein alpha-component [Pseudomonas furukawaii]BAU73100.1 sulfite reductase [NADPH] flavoprotein alpha-component [Pseudomonas furukawaii]
MKIQVLFGTETGNAEMVADDIVDALAHEVDISAADMSKFQASELTAETFYIIVCSTYGDGELPNSAQPFFAALNSEKPDLKGLRFAVFGLGDSFYATYNRGSEIIAEQLIALGGLQVGERGLHDASSGELPGDIAMQWAKEILSAL